MPLPNWHLIDYGLDCDSLIQAVQGNQNLSKAYI